MTVVDRWLLPDGVDELLPDMAVRVERLRRNILDLYTSWGYDLVIPPLVEFTDSLLSGTGSDLDLRTFKITDQISGRMMGVRADVTPQTARMDAHSLRRDGPNRLCYASSVLYTRQQNALASRNPIQIGVELYGEPGLEADCEVIQLMVETLQLAGLPQVNLDLGHVGIYRSLIESTSLDNEQQQELFKLLQGKAVPELTGWLKANIDNPQMVQWISQLVNLTGDETVLDQAREIFSEAPAEVELALDELQVVVDAVRRQTPNAEVFLDLGELRGYHYHTGIVFAAFVPGLGQAIGNGGRYDHVGEAFGRSRPATGFSLDLKALARISGGNDAGPKGIFAPADDNPGWQQAVAKLRSNGERVICGFSGQQPDFVELNCDRQLVFQSGAFTVVQV